MSELNVVKIVINMSMATIRVANIKDAPGITQCINNAYQHYVSRLGKPPGPMLEDYADIISEHVVYIAEVPNKIVGVMVLMENYSPVLLDNLAVDPCQQGTGLGRQLLLLAEDVARKAGHDSIQLYTHELMHENIDYYHHHDYQISHRVTEKGYQRIYMTKTLVRQGSA